MSKLGQPPVMKPLILDVDGTFLRTDMLMECFWHGLGTAPLATLGIVARNWKNRARLKRELAALAPIRTDLLPVNPQIADLATRSADQGRTVLFASGSDAALVRRHGIDVPGEPFSR